MAGRATSGMQDIIKGVMKYRSTLQKELTKHFEAVQGTPKVSLIINI